MSPILRPMFLLLIAALASASAPAQNPPATGTPPFGSFGGDPDIIKGVGEGVKSRTHLVLEFLVAMIVYPTWGIYKFLRDWFTGIHFELQILIRSWKR